MMSMRIFAVSAIILAFAISCSDQELTTMEQLAKDIQTIDKYLDDNGIVALEDPSGVRYTFEVEGTGPKPTLSNTVVVKYIGKLFDGTVFDGTTTDPAVFRLLQLIEGWQIGFQLLPQGSKATLYIPSGLGYGKSGGGPIPPNANLIFDVELIEVR